MSNDWWTPTASSSSYHTPGRSSNTHTNAFNNGITKSRFAGDDLDPEDIRMAENMKFLPSFASSPAGKAILGNSPGGNTSGLGGAGSGGSGSGGIGSGSPPINRRSPTSRFSIGESTSSPRDGRRRTINSGGGIDEDMPPTASLRDAGETPTRSVPNSSYSQNELPPPPSLTASSNTTALHVFGPPPSILSTLEPYLETCGAIKSYTPGPDGSNWYIVEYTSPTAAAYALRRHGEIVNGRYMIGFKVFGPGSTMGCTLVDGIPTQSAQRNDGSGQEWSVVGSSNNNSTGAGTPMVLRTGHVFQKPKENPAKLDGDYSWEEQQPTGLANRIAEWLFGR